MNQKTASRILSTLDGIGNDIETLIKKGVVSKEAGEKIVRSIDTAADNIQVAAYGKEAFEAYQQKISKVLKKDPDEKYMETFENPQKPIKTDADEPYMKHAPGGFNSKGIDTYDSDDTSQVSERDEYDVRDLSEHADKTKKQPSWPKGSSGKSTRQGSQKTWAP